MEREGRVKEARVSEAQQEAAKGSQRTPDER